MTVETQLLKGAARDALSLVRSRLRKERLVIGYRMLPEPVKLPGEYTDRFYAPLLNKKRQEVGAVRAVVRVPFGLDSPFMHVRLDWTIHPAGFWYTKFIKVPLVDGSAESSDFVGLGGLIRGAQLLANQVVGLRSMNRAFKKIKKNKVQDLVFQQGMRVKKSR